MPTKLRSLTTVSLAGTRRCWRWRSRCAAIGSSSRGSPASGRRACGPSSGKTSMRASSCTSARRRRPTAHAAARAHPASILDRRRKENAATFTEDGGDQDFAFPSYSRDMKRVQAVAEVKERRTDKTKVGGRQPDPRAVPARAALRDARGLGLMREDRGGTLGSAQAVTVAETSREAQGGVVATRQGSTWFAGCVPTAPHTCRDSVAHRDGRSTNPSLRGPHHPATASDQRRATRSCPSRRRSL